MTKSNDAFIERFELTDEHLRLLGSMWVEWGGFEFGAPIIDGKRPYGNSDVYQDIAEILGEPLEDDVVTGAQLERYDRLHRETQTALQIVLRTRSFEPGVYVCDKYDVNWRKT